MQIKRYPFLIMLWVVVVFFALMGCGDSNTTDNSSGSSNNIANPEVKIVTKKGNIIFEMFPKSAPDTVAHITKLINERFYDGMTVHRVEKDFVIQMGDPGCRTDSAPLPPVDECDGSGGSDETVKLEIDSTLSFKRGSVGMARLQNDPNSNDSQFFICLGDALCAQLSGSYTIFGKVIGGIGVVDKIVKGDVIESITISE